MDDAFPARPRPRVGERWTVRHRLADGSATDVLGWVEQADQDGWLLVDGSGEQRRIARASIVLARRAPAAAGGPPPSRTSAAELERAAADGWIAHGEPLGAWLLRSGGGFTGRANSCLAVGDPGLPLAEAADRVVVWSQEQGIPPLVQVVDGSGEETALRTLGWRPAYVPTLVLACRLSDLLGERLPADEPAARSISVSEQLSEVWLAAYRRSRPNDCDPTTLRAILDGRPPRAFAGYVRAAPESPADVVPAVAGGGAFGAIARAHVSAGWAGFAAVWTAPDLRRRGIATALLRVLGHWAARRGARNAYLQVAAANTAAVEAYGRLGFAPHHAYGYLRPPGD